jgi:methionine-gamma-lyase
MRNSEESGASTRAVHVGNEYPPGAIPLRLPLVMANSYRLPASHYDMDWSVADGDLVYNRDAGVNQLGLQGRLSALETAEDTVVLASGVAALHAVFFCFLNSGDHVIVGDIAYEAVWRLLDELLPRKYGVESTFVDTSDLDAVKRAMRPNTKLVHTETIANPTTRVADVGALAAIAHRAGALLSVDATFTPPVTYRPLADGADLVIHSLTKHINGHGDAMGGAVSGSKRLISVLKEDAMLDVGGIISPFNAWMIMRGISTLPLRFERQCRTALRIAQLLEDDRRVAFTAYPGLPSHPQHAVAARQFGDANGGVVAFALDGPAEVFTAFVDALRLLTPAVSLGHDESLIVHVGAAVEAGRRGSNRYPEPFRRLGHLRFSAGLEDVEDLESDILQALQVAFQR